MAFHDLLLIGRGPAVRGGPQHSSCLPVEPKGQRLAQLLGCQPAAVVTHSQATGAATQRVKSLPRVS